MDAETLKGLFYAKERELTPQEIRIICCIASEFNGESTRKEIIEATKLSHTRISIVVNNLKLKGILEEEKGKLVFA